VTASDLELLATEIEVLWGIDSRGRYSEAPLATIAVAAGGTAVVPGLRVRDYVAAQLEAAVAAPRPPVRDHVAALLEAAVAAPRPAELSPERPPRALEVCRELLEHEGFRISVSAGPSYAVERPVPPDIPLPVVRSTDVDAREAVDRGSRPESWLPGEWDRLLDGTLGPWAMVVDGTTVVSICHTPRDTRWGAEAGTWTDPDHRGRGYAAAATAVWAAVLGNGRDRPLYYSTDGINVSSRRVAERIGLRPLGWLWKLVGGPAVRR
jgi:RimJ/RimL family protein N-acetyltransferase